MNVYGRIFHRIRELVKVVSRWFVPLRTLKPGMATRVTITGSKYELFRTRCANAINGSLVIGKNKARCHVVGLVHDSEYNFLVVPESTCKLLPELFELLGSSGFGIACIPNDATSSWLLGRVIVPHVVVGIEYLVRNLLVKASQLFPLYSTHCIGTYYVSDQYQDMKVGFEDTFCDRYVVNGVLVESEMCFVEYLPQTCCRRTHSFEQERDTVCHVSFQPTFILESSLDGNQCYYPLTGRD